MEHALILSPSEKGTDFLTQALMTAGISCVTALQTGEAARGLLHEQTFDLVVINAPLRDEFGESLACGLTENGQCQVLLLIKAEIWESVARRTEERGVITLPKPIDRMLLQGALHLAAATHKRLQILRQENQRLLQKITDTRTVGRAKCVLISRMSVTEPEAHRYIEKLAMDQRQTRCQIAEEILRTYGL